MLGKWGSLYFDFKGTVTRQQFWLHFMLPIFALQVGARLLVQVYEMDFLDDIWPTAEIVTAVIALPVQLAIIWSALAVCSKRLFSAGFPRRTLLAAVPTFGVLWVVFELLFSPDKEER
ncbi:hypothetical protein CS022_21470 [Veronia nyctiphanis]|uniref:DUF805 domain-containing protein n=1 Tax=Veronia nyctiphanis TaxID=1278244 RepID=A0A4Q0YMN2_9GAMM|nr:DUF805 domain-containing protein [Veronia nyctiphanis]RXJ71234.1 hypothetical protein CS022_21470 [Veronia nyctiphanis]